MKTKRIIIVFLMLLIMSGMLNIKISNAKTITYYDAFYMKEISEYNCSTVTKIVLKKNKIILTGTLCKYTSSSNSLKKLKNKTRTFRLDKNVKFYKVRGNTVDIEKYYKISKKTFKNFIKKPNDSSIDFIVKNGKVSRIDLCS